MTLLDQDEFIRRIRSFEPDVDEALLRRAHAFGIQAHQGQTRASGEPYISHPLAVACLLAEKRIDVTAIVSGILHDTVEDTAVTLEDIHAAFGREVALLVDGVTKLSQLVPQTEFNRKAENFRKLVLAMSQDMRILLIKLADRLHNMRTLSFLPKPEKQKRIALETIDIYTPLAERIGIRDWQEELEDRSFAVLEPEAWRSITNHLRTLQKEDYASVRMIISALESLLKRAGLTAKVTGRTKTPRSIWRKMNQQGINLEQLHDIIAFRIVVPSSSACYQALGVIHEAYPVIPGRFKDYISLSKPNGYQSIHTCVIGPEKHTIEIQIRTDEMHETAELGMAAHWRYKHNVTEPFSSREHSQYDWMRTMLDILSNTGNSGEFLENTRMDMFPEQVFAFTPKGELFVLPRGATPVDFAYAIHTDIGNHCIAAKINGRIAPLRTILQNGDQVDIRTARNQTPNPGWEHFVRTGKAKACIRRFLRLRKRDQYIAFGRDIIVRTFQQAGRDGTDKALKSAVERLQCATLDTLYARVGEGILTAREVLYAAYPDQRDLDQNPSRERLLAAGSTAKRTLAASSSAVPLRGLARDMAVRYARCCHPVPGDSIVGIITTGKGITVHAAGCKALEKKFSDQPERWIDLSWNMEEETDACFTGRINVSVLNAPGGLATLSNAIGHEGGNIANLFFTRRSQDFIDLVADVEVKHAQHLHRIIKTLQAVPEVHRVRRSHE